jgi:hypothetical protein
MPARRAAKAAADIKTAPPASVVTRAIAKALKLLHTLDRFDPAVAHQIRRSLFVDAGAPLTAAERARFGNIFRASLFQRQELDLFWLPAERHITTRRTIDGILPRRALPEGAIYIGSYRDPIPESHFLEDLDHLLQAIRSSTFERV